MQTSTINKAIKKKIDAWIATINDTTLQADLKKSVLVSCGSITSMFLNEKVNDFDIYLQDRTTLLDLVTYYTKNFKEEVKVFDGQKKQTYIDEYRGDFTSEDFLKHQGYTPSCIRNLKEDQVKLYFPSKDGGYRPEIATEDKEAGLYLPCYFSANAISLTDDIQIVIRFWGNNEVIHKTFDFIHATNYWTYNTGCVLNVDALESLLSKQLRYQGSLYPVTSIIRSRKFIKRGFNINAGETSENNVSNLFA